jgi:hypothetical protein
MLQLDEVEEALKVEADAVRAILGDQQHTFWSLISHMPWEVREGRRPNRGGKKNRAFFRVCYG